MLLIDGDLYVYKLGFSRLSMDETPPLGFVLGNLKTTLNALLSRFETRDYRLFLTSSDYSNYRYDIATIKPYKGGRKKCSKCDSRCSSEFTDNRDIQYICRQCGPIDEAVTYSDKPPFYKEIREYLLDNWNAELVHGQEADDAISIAAVKSCVRPDSYAGSDLMIHIDKDINNTPGFHLNPDKEGTVYFVSPQEALNNFYTQFLLGDNVDYIPGVLGCGKVYAKKVLEGCAEPRDYEEVLLDVFQGESFNIKGFKNTMNLSIDEAYRRLTEIGQLLWIRREENELWKPTISI